MLKKLRLLKHFSTNKKVTFYLLFYFLCLSDSIIAKNNLGFTKIDSLLTIIKMCNEDSIKVNALLKVSKEYLIVEDFNKSITNINQAINLSKKISFLNGQRQGFIYSSNYYNKLNNKYEELKCLHQALSISEKMSDKNKAPEVNAMIGEFYWGLGKYEMAKKYFKTNLRIFYQIKNLRGLAWNYYCIGTLNDLLDNDEAISNFSMALSIAKSYETTLSDKIYLYDIRRLIGLVYNNTANVYVDKKKFNIALAYYDSSIFINKKIDNVGMIGGTYQNIAGIYYIQQNYLEAIKFYTKALEISEPIKSEFCYDICKSLGTSYLRINEHEKAKYFFLKSQSLINNIYYESDFGKKKYFYETRIILDSLNSNFRLAFQDFRQFIIYKDSAENIESKNKAFEEGMNYEFEKKVAFAKSEQERNEAISKKEIEKQKLVRNSFIGGFILVLIIAIGVFISLLQNRKAKAIIVKQKAEVDHKNREILDSIEYALRIQTAILPPNKVVKQFLENSFIYYKPKDIVAGDFYWMETINDLVLFAACDCTGHGVPGAMVSVVCHNSLNRAVREFGLTKPSSILDKTAEIVLESFSKSEEEIQDGMDISICALNTKTKTLEWAGANNSLLLIQNGVLTETKANKQCIGHNDNVKPFTNHTFNLQADTNIYLFTDGFPDQFGGPHQKKLTKSRFKELLISLQHLQLQEQVLELDKFILNYKKDTEQTDDILIIGVSI